VLWVVQDKEMFLQALGYGGPKLIDFVLGLSGLFFWKFIANFIWSYFYSTLATVIICARIVGWCFREYHEIFLGPGEDDRSNLWKTNVYEREYYESLPAPKGTKDPSSATLGHDTAPSYDPTDPTPSLPTQLQSDYRNLSVAPPSNQFGLEEEPPRGAVNSPWQPVQQPAISVSHNPTVRSLVQGSVV
jgi:hypothetical protein